MGQAFRASAPRADNRAPEIIGSLDIGTSKICCLIAAATSPPRLLGIGHQRARGIVAGMVVDLDEAEQAVRTAVARAERQAGVTLEAVDLSVSGGQLASTHFAATTTVATGVVSDLDLHRLAEGARAYSVREGRALVHMNRIAYRLDASAGIRDPRGMAGRTLVGDIHAVTADDGPIRNLRMLLERCFLTPARFTPAGLASARAVATPEELHQGVTVIDIGAGTTSLAMIREGHDIFVDSLPVGGDHLTYDIRAVLGTSLAEAERIKVLYGTLVEAGSDERDVVTYQRLNDPLAAEAESELYQTTRAHLRQLLVPRVESLLAQVLERLVASGLQGYGGGRIVLTGGGSQLVGLPIFAGRIWSRPVRVALPQPLSGMGSSSCTPSLATAIGLIAAAANPATLECVGVQQAADHYGYLGRVGQWLRENF